MIMHQEIQNRLQTAISQDEIYQQLLVDCKAMERGYLRIISNLTDEDRERLERYIALGEELEHRRTWIAMELAEKMSCPR